ncbi:hypothetical protein C8J56DRAFT_895658 [Mycena floridula]|nr:hypothetical protein C8J56DRAFT_895658 [Mycena floridula]
MKRGAVIFADLTKRSKLDTIVHSRVRRAMVWNVLWMWATGKKICILDVPLLIEGGLWKWVGKVIIVYCTTETQLAGRFKDRSRAGIACGRIEKGVGESGRLDMVVELDLSAVWDFPSSLGSDSENCNSRGSK